MNSVFRSIYPMSTNQCTRARRPQNTSTSTYLATRAPQQAPTLPQEHLNKRRPYPKSNVQMHLLRGMLNTIE
eukprot:775273-Amphidinium_carterae.1